MDKNLVIELRFPRVKILLKLITSFVEENTEEPWVEIIEITKFSIDIQGYCHGASCMQANGAEGRKNNRLNK